MRQVQITGLSNIVPPYTIEACDAFLENCQFLYGGSGTIPPTLTLTLPDKFDSTPITTIKITDSKSCISFKTIECDVRPCDITYNILDCDITYIIL